MANQWQPYAPSAAQPWNIQRVWHLHRRAGFGATWAELQRDLHDGPQRSVQRVLDGTSRSYAQREDFDSIARVIAEAASGSDDENRLKAAWLFRMLFSPNALLEKLTLMWHNHFATSNLKVDNLAWMWQQNELLRRYAMNSFDEMLHAIVQDPAMLIWLDANSNRRGHPNENFARELMELFTLGVGNYNEQDVQAAAKALTGWSVAAGQSRFRSEHHDAEAKTVLGINSKFNAESLVDLLCQQPATSRRIAWRLCETLMGEDVASLAAIDELANELRSHKLSIRHAVSIVLHSDLFFSTANLKSRVSSPVEHVVSTVRCLELLDAPPSTLILARWANRMGQDLFRPPNVGGWPGGRSWLNTRNIIARANFAQALAGGQLHSPTLVPDFQPLIDRCRVNLPSKLSEAELFSLLCLGSDTKADSPSSGATDWLANCLSSPEAFLI